MSNSAIQQFSNEALGCGFGERRRIFVNLAQNNAENQLSLPEIDSVIEILEGIYNELEMTLRYYEECKNRCEDPSQESNELCDGTITRYEEIVRLCVDKLKEQQSTIEVQGYIRGQLNLNEFLDGRSLDFVIKDWEKFLNGEMFTEPTPNQSEKEVKRDNLRLYLRFMPGLIEMARYLQS